MPGASIRFAESAVADLEGLGNRYASQGVPAVRDRIAAEILARIDMLADHPEMGRIVPEFGQPLLRELINPPFRIVYRREPKRLRIVRIWRSERVLVLPEEET